MNFWKSHETWNKHESCKAKHTTGFDSPDELALNHF